MHFTGSKVSLLLAGSCVLGCWAVGFSRACDVWGGIACAAAVLVAGQRLGRLSRVDRALGLPARGRASWRGVGSGGC